MRLGLVRLMWLVCVVMATTAVAHPADEYPQVTLEVSINDTRVTVLSLVPARHVSKHLFPNNSPIDLDRLEPADLAKRVEPMLAERCPLKIDGVVVPPTVVLAEMRMTGARLPVRSFSERQALDRGYLIFMVEYETKGKPRRVDLDWTIYANDYDDVGEPIYPDEELAIVAVTRGYGQEEFMVLTPLEPGYTWHDDEGVTLPADLLATQPVQQNFLQVPVPSIAIVLIGLVCAGVTLGRSKQRAIGLIGFSVVAAVVCLPYGKVAIEQSPTLADLQDDEALAIFESLHRNIYRAFDYTDEGAVYDALAQSVDGPMLETIYNDVYQSLIMRDENGAVSKVVRVEIEEAKLIETATTEASAPVDDLGSYVVRARWQVDGLVTHFGHAHARTNAFEAIYTVAPRADGWRIVKSEILNQQRIDDGQQSAEDLVNQP